MQNVSAEWKNVNQRLLLPESFLEISCRVPDITYGVSAVEVLNEATFSKKDKVVSEGSSALPLYATMEHNMWSLDGTRGILPDSGEDITPGYVSQDDSPTELTVVLSETVTSVVPGFTITWSSEFSEYPNTFTVIAKNGETVVDSITVTGNTSVKTAVDLETEGFDRITIEPHDWVLPSRRTRVDKVVIGHELTFNKGNIVSYQHEHSGDILCGELPKNTIRFSILNVDGQWNPSNPSGLWRYLSDRQKITARYGISINGNIEWIPAGVFYLSDWNAPANGLEASFEARDIFEFLLNEPYTGRSTGTLAEMVSDALGDLLPNVVFTQAMENTSGTLSGDETAAEVIQMCANAGCSSVYQDRDGSLVFKDWPTYAVSEYVIDTSLAYSHPEITLSKPLRGIFVTYGSNEEALDIPVGTTGEVQTVKNPLVGTVEQAVLVADWIKTVLETRRTVAGEFRADPRLDLYDIVTVMSKHGAILPVVITNIQYSYTGCFKASYTGRVITSGASSIVGEFVLGESRIV
jgi:hypothetical protein